MTTERPPPGDRTLSQLIQAAADRKCPYCKVEPQQPCTWPSPDKYHAARFNRIGMTQAERHTIAAATRPDSGRHTGPKGYLVGELRPYRPEPQPERETGAAGGRRTSTPEPRPYELGLTADPDLSREATGIAMPRPRNLGLTSNPELGRDDTEPEPEPDLEAE